MEKEYTLQGLGCANCAGKIETAVRDMDGISAASVNYMTTSLTLETNETYNGNIDIDIEKIVHKYEPDIMVIDKKGNLQNKHGHAYGGTDDGKKKLLIILAGALIFGAGILIEQIFEPGVYVKLAVFLLSYIILGGSVVLRAVMNISRGQIFDENFLMCVATIGAFAIGDFAEAAAVMLFYQVGEYFQDAAVRRSKKSITELMDIRPDFANLKKGNEIIKVSPETVKTGDIIVVKPGEKIPLDGVVIDGSSMLDTSALTGESVPRSAKPSDSVISGCINQSRVLTIEVTKTYGESTVAKIIDLVENAGSKKAPTENFITTFSRYYTPIVVGLATLLAIVPPLLLGGEWAEWIKRGLIFLVISCPCALVISIPLGFFGGIGGASRKGILVKGGNYLEALNKLDIVVFDKTGTLTKGVFEVTDVLPAGNYTKEDLLEYAAHAEAFSNHPIALSIAKAYGKQVDKGNLEDYREIPGYGTKVKIKGKEVLAGNSKLIESEGIFYEEHEEIGTKIYVAVDNEFAGCIIISDEIKPDSRETIGGLKEYGVRKTVMLTGDNASIGDAIASELKLDEVYTELLPDQKVEHLEMLDAQKIPKSKLAYVGDGINDAPVLARADIGIAMGGLGSDAAVEAADVVLMTDEPSKLLDAISIAKATKRIVWQNIVFALGIKGAFLLMGAFGIATMWEAVFADVGVALLAVLNAMRVMRIK